ncbi:uncharacterized protein MYCFIDRAFT_86729 [Pseudocercospora fijiensis CIRAD86]|uniref:Methyltransferase domain-containing protein n=1 Tax=Pseudocercospora fijiensis (strain CIRAD86) TaxID=383855 RepID=M2YQH3_PSEFD|nr:uncharacterized protein MYCFIDRAFT_86729 [Pseudocercospora fijiensis CIRAD86]EME79980.1 hypothetical protein MYCFIDRAFT_86729 [Pseudocercospora fijiensis CIRAD86]
MGPSEEGKALATPEFWNTRYSKSDGSTPTHEWFQTFSALKPFLDRHLLPTTKSNPRILHLGSGDSTIPFDLAKLGYANQICIDFSQVVIDLMNSRADAVTSGIEWICADVRDMSDTIASNSVDVAFDKGTLDAMIHGSPWSPPEDVVGNCGRYLDEVRRVLKDDGVFLYVTYRQPHFMKPLLNPEGKWEMEMEVLGGGGGSSFEYFGWGLRKGKEA